MSLDKGDAPQISSIVWFVRGTSGIASVPALILMVSFIGFGVLCRESGLTLGQSVFMTASVWALPSQVVLVGSVASGASLLVTAIAVSLSAVRLTPMVAAWVPMVRQPQTPRWRLLGLSHFVAITAWVWSFLKLPALPRAARIPYFAGFAVTLSICNIAVTAASYVLAGALPVEAAAALFFLTPIYFLTALSAAARIPAERYALAIGLVLGPLLSWLDVGLDLLWAGLGGGTLAWLAARLWRGKA
jgi:predicted branched-subunit amino acid permease